MTPDNEVQPTSVPGTGVPPKTCEHESTISHDIHPLFPNAHRKHQNPKVGDYCSGPKQVAQPPNNERNPMTLADQIRPLGDNIVLRLIEKPKESAGGVALPDTAALPAQEGIVVAMGPGELRCVHCGSEGQRKPMPPIKVGSRVLFTQWAGSEVRADGDKLFLLKAHADILAIVEQDA